MNYGGSYLQIKDNCLCRKYICQLDDNKGCMECRVHGEVSCPADQRCHLARHTWVQIITICLLLFVSINFARIDLVKDVHSA